MGGITGALYQQFAITIAISVLLSVGQRADAQPGAGGAAAQAADRQEDAADAVLQRLQQGVRLDRRTATSASPAILVRKMFREPRVHRRADLRDRRARAADPGRLRAGRGPGLHPGQRAAARCGVARAHRRRHEEGRGDPGEERGRRGLQHDHAATRCSPAPTRRTWASSSCSSSRGRSAQHRGGARQRRGRGAQPRVRAADSGSAASWPSGRPPFRASAPAPASRCSCRIAAADRRTTWPSRPQRFMEAARKRPEIGRINTLYRATRAADLRRHRSQQGAEVGRAAAATSTPRSARCSAAPTSTTSTGSAASTRCTCRPSRSSGRIRSSSGCSSCANQDGRHGAARHAGDDASRRSGPEFTNRFNLFRSAELTGVPAAGFSSAQALDALEETATRDAAAGHELRLGRHVVPGAQRAGRRRSCSRSRSSSCSSILAAQYESWGLPFSVLLGTPFAAFGAYLGLWLARQFSGRAT